MKKASCNDGRLDLPAFWLLLSEIEDGSCDPARYAGLQDLLRDSPAARRAYLEYFQQSAVLRMEAATRHELGLIPLVEYASRFSFRTFQRSLLAAAALVALAALVAALIVVSIPDPPRLAAEVTADTRWSIDGVAQDATLGTKDVMEGSTMWVRSGTVRLAMESGDQLAIQGPARVAFPSLHRPVVESGWLWIDAGKSAKPFVVEAGRLEIRNTGTRFGVRVPQFGASPEVHLVKGRVEVRARKGGAMLDELAEPGMAAAFPDGGGSVEIAMAVDPFPSLPELLARPADYRTTVLGQSPVGYWPLDEPVDRSVANLIANSSTGTLAIDVRSDESGPEPVDGFRGLPEKHGALYFDGGEQQSVLTGLDGLHGVKRNEGAVSFWLRRQPGEIPRDEVLWLAGFRGDHPRVPGLAVLHTRLTSSGRLVFELRNDDGDVQLMSSRSVADGNWHHVLASWGPGSVDLYLNGRLVARDAESRTLDDGEFRGRFVRFGKPSLDQLELYNPFTGWVDEIALWDRPLTPVEVESQYQSAVGREGK